MVEREIWDHLLNRNLRLTRALVAIRDGHEAGREFLTSEGETVPERPISTLRASIDLAEQVASVALAIVTGGPDIEQNVLRAMLLRFGRHLEECEPDDSCVCSWDNVRAAIGASDDN